MLYMVIETYTNGPRVVYERFRDRGRMAPEGLMYVSSWVDTRLHKCFQLMETGDPALFELWTANWSDIVDFEIVPVLTSAAAAELVMGPTSAV